MITTIIKKSGKTTITEFLTDNPSDICEYVYVRTVNLIASANISQSDFCKAIGINNTAPSRWKNGTTVSLKTIPKICNYFDITVAEFFKDFK